MSEQRIHYLRPQQAAAIIKEKPLAYLPLGLVEWHGPHLPFGVDAFNAQAVALRAAQQSGGLVFPTLFIGTERERDAQTLDWLGFDQEQWLVGMDFPANNLPSMYAREDIFALTVRENLRLMAAYGLRLIVIVSGHAAVNQLQTLQRLAAEFNSGGETRVLVCLPFISNDDGLMEVGHASRIETAVMLALQPQTVKMDELPAADEPLRNQDWGIIDYLTFSGQPTADRIIHEQDDPRRATAQAGEEMLHKAAQNIVRQVKKALP